MKIFGQGIVVLGFLIVGLALTYPHIDKPIGPMVSLYALMDAPWTNQLLIFGFPGLLLLSYFVNRHFVYRFHRKLIGCIQIVIGLLANYLLIVNFGNIFDGKALSKGDSIIITTSILWWPLAYFYFISLLRHHPQNQHIIRAVWTTGGMFLLLEIVRGLGRHITHFSYWLENQTYSVLTVSGFALIFLGGIITEVAMLRTAKHT